MRDWLDKASADLFAMIASGKVTLQVDTSHALADAAKAHAALEGRRTTGSLVLVP